jgi:hypothetical protein
VDRKATSINRGEVSKWIGIGGHHGCGLTAYASAAQPAREIVALTLRKQRAASAASASWAPALARGHANEFKGVGISRPGIRKLTKSASPFLQGPWLPLSELRH